MQTQNFRDYLFDLMKQKQARSSIRLQFSALRSFFRFLVARNRLTKNPVREVAAAEVGEKAAACPDPSADQRTAYRTTPVKKPKSAPVWMPQRDVAIMEVFYSSGLRLAELASLDVNDLDIYTESVRVMGKGRKERQEANDGARTDRSGAEADFDQRVEHRLPAVRGADSDVHQRRIPAESRNRIGVAQMPAERLPHTCAIRAGRVGGERGAARDPAGQHGVEDAFAGERIDQRRGVADQQDRADAVSGSTAGEW